MKNRILQSYKDGLINKYMAQRLNRAVNSGMTDGLYDEMEHDAKDASEFGVNSDKDYNVYFFISRFADDTLNDGFGISLLPDQKRDLCRYMFENKDGDYKFDNLVDYYILTHKWLCDRISKKAHPNVGGKDNREPVQDLDKWISTLKNIYAVLSDKRKKARKQDVIDNFTQEWDLDEKYKFTNWMRFYEGHNTEKYNVKNANLLKNAFGSDIPIPRPLANRGDTGMNLSTYKPQEKTKREQELELAKSFKLKMRSRLNSLRRLINKYNEILPKQSLDVIYDEIHSLEKSISRLNVYASMQDCVIRSANRIQKFGFSEGADFLKKIAEGDEVLQALPAPTSKEPDLPAQPKLNINIIIDRLAAISKILKSRDMIRELASIDILLNEMGLASYFPELSEGQSKLIDSFGYTSNKIESIIAKLRGTGKAEPESTAVPPIPAKPIQTTPKDQKPIETGEVLTKPVGEIKKELPSKKE